MLAAARLAGIWLARELLAPSSLVSLAFLRCSPGRGVSGGNPSSLAVASGRSPLMLPFSLLTSKGTVIVLVVIVEEMVVASEESILDGFPIGILVFTSATFPGKADVLSPLCKG